MNEREEGKWLTSIEKMYAGQELSAIELNSLVSGLNFDMLTKDTVSIVDVFDEEIGECWQRVQTIIQAGKDFWAIDWGRALSKNWGNIFFDQPYRVERKERQVTQVYYEKVEE